MWKKTYSQYVEMFKENNPWIIQSIANYQNQNKEEYEEDKQSNKDYTEESNESNDNNLDYNFNYENTLQWSCIRIIMGNQWNEPVEWVGAVAI